MVFMSGQSVLQARQCASRIPRPRDQRWKEGRTIQKSFSCPFLMPSPSFLSVPFTGEPSLHVIFSFTTELSQKRLLLMLQLLIFFPFSSCFCIKKHAGFFFDSVEAPICVDQSQMFHVESRRRMSGREREKENT